MRRYSTYCDDHAPLAASCARAGGMPCVRRLLSEWKAVDLPQVRTRAEVRSAEQRLLVRQARSNWEEAYMKLERRDGGSWQVVCIYKHDHDTRAGSRRGDEDLSDPEESRNC